MADTATTKTGKSSFLRWLRLTLGVIITVASLYFLVNRLLRDWHQIPWNDIHFRPVLLIGSFLFLLAFHLPLNGLGWKLILQALDAPITLIRAIAITAVAQIGKYAPGKVWFTLGRMSMAKQDGIPESKTMVSVLIEIGFALLAAVALLGFAVLLIPRSVVPRSVYLLFLLAPVTLVCIYPPVLNRILRFFLLRLKRPVFELRMSYWQILRTVGVYFIDWTLQGTACFILISSFYPLPLARLPVLIGGYAMSWMLGFLVLIAPAGLGVREGVYTVILQTVVPAPIAIISALVTRVWMAISELVMAGLCLPLVTRRRKHAQETETRPD